MKKALSLILATIMLLGALSVLCSLPVSAATWTAEQPKGSGTQEDPYLIATPGNFIWIQKNMNNSAGKDTDTDGNGEKDFATYEFGKTSFVGVYFEQVCDIDFEGAELNSIGDYLCDTAVFRDGSKEINKIYGGFGGVYNGNGFALKNATVTAVNTKKDNTNWCVGLFGSIYGATLKNIVLDNIDVTANNPHAGILVGKAYAPTVTYDEATGNTITHPDSVKTDFNVIENILITDTCSVTATTAVTEKPNMSKSVKVGSIAGSSVGTTIRNCINNGAVTMAIGCSTAGGILGAAGHSTVVDHCVNNGPLALSARPSTLTTNADETPVGGIVGFILAKAAYSSDSNYVAAGTGVKISNCVNTGTYTITSTTTGLGTNMWGGILGAVNSLTECTDEPGDYSYLIENCHNTYAGPSLSSTRKGGIIGSGWNHATNKSQYVVDTIYIKDCMSVDVANGAYAGTNEFNCQINNTADGLQSIMVLGLNAALQAGTYTSNDKKTSYDATAGQAYTVKTRADKTYATRALGDFIYVAKADGTGYELSTTTFRNVVDALTNEIKNTQALGKTVVAIGHQKGLDGTNNEGAYRIVFGINKLEYRDVTISVAKTVEGGSTTFATASSDVVYTSVKAFTKDGETEVTAESKGVAYLTTLTIKDIPAEGTVTYTVKAGVTNRDTAKTRTAGDTVVLKFVNGVLESATVK